MPTDQTLFGLLTEHIQQGLGERTALADETSALSYRDLVRAISERIRQLREHAVGEGHRVALVAANDISSVVDFAAANAVGAAVLVLHHRMSPDERQVALTTFGAQFVTGCGDNRADTVHRVDSPTTHAPALALVTSGTQGRPKVVERQWAGSMANSVAYAHALGLEPDDCVLTTSPLNHSYALEAGVLAALAVGAAHVIPAVPTPPPRLRTLADQHEVTVLQTVPALYRWYGQAGIAGARRWKRCVSAGETLPPEVADSWAIQGAALWNHYGATEIGQITIGPAGPPGSVGWPVSGIELRCTNQNAAVQVRCADLAPVRITASGVEPLTDAAGFVTMGDTGRIDHAGRLHLAGRLGTMINIAGNKVDPSEVEHAIRSQPAIRDCAVVGRPGPDGTTQLWAFVEPEDTDFDPAALRRQLRGRLSPAKVPAVIRPIAHLPRTGTGKIRRWLLTESEADVAHSAEQPEEIQ